MTKGFHKKTSKRVPLKRRYKIEKQVKEHNRKIKKLARKQKLSKKAHQEAKRKEVMEQQAKQVMEKKKMKQTKTVTSKVK